MTNKVIVVHATEQPPERWTASLFLAGPTPRSAEVASWRPAAVAEIERRWDGPGTLVVFHPEPRDQVWSDYEIQRTWELRWGDRCDVVLFWIPRGPGMPALTTNDEWGRWKDSGRVVLGTPPDAQSVRYQRNYALDHDVPVLDTLADTVATTLASLGSGADRAGGRRHVPLLLWRQPSFQSWLDAQEGAGNELLEARLEWTLRPGGHVVFWVLRVLVRVAGEDHVEVVRSGPDVATVLGYRPAAALADTEIVLVRASAAACCGLPGGSHPTSTDPATLAGAADPAALAGSTDPATLAATEFREETGLSVAPDRLVTHRSRQLAATVTAHRQHLFSVELTSDELDQLRRTGPVHDRITHPRVLRLRDLLATDQADWTTLGAVAEVLLSRPVPDSG